MYYHLDPTRTTILSGPHNATDTAVKALTSCGNPELLDLAAYDMVPEWREAVDAPLGWQSPVLETRDGVVGVAVYAAGTPEERATALAQQAREGMSCSRAQGKLALLQVGLIELVEAWVAAQSQAVQIEYADRNDWRRTWPLIEEARVVLGKTPEEIDALFSLAVTL
jgi:hypothetical protein